MTLKLLQFLYRETSGSKVRVVTGSLVSGISRGLLLATFNAAALAGTEGHADLPLLLAGFAGALLLFVLSTYNSTLQAQRAIGAMTERLRLRFCAKLLHAQLRFLEAHGTADIYAHLSVDLARLSAAATSFLGIFQSLVLLAFALAYLGWLSLWGLAVTAAAIPTGALIYYIQDQRARKALMQTRALQRRFYSRIHDLLHGFKDMKLSRARQAGLMTDIGEIAHENRDLYVETEKLFLVNLLTSQTFTFAVIAVLVFVLPAFFPSERTTVFQFLATILFLVGSLEKLMTSIPSISRANISFESIEELEASLNEGIAEESGDAQAGTPAPFRSVALKKAHFRFSHQGAGESFDVGPIDLELKRNEIVFVVGGNGAGKTTFLKLLTGLYPPSSGAILVNGTEVAESGRQSYREMFAAVFSDYHLFQRLYGLEPPEPEVADALLAQLQIGHKTSIRGDTISNINLSTGQGKRLAYAVARLADRQIYIFDEFAADQDPAFRRFFYTELLPALRADGKTIVAVTHDDRWFSVADRVIKMDYGRIVEIAVKDRVGV